MMRLTKKEIYSTGVFLCLLLEEFFTIWGGVHNHCEHWFKFAIGTTILLIMILIIGFCDRSFKLESPTFTNLLANAIAPRFISVLYLLGFLMHLSWMTDGVLNYLIGDSWIIPLCVGSSGLLILWIAFPNTTIGKNNNKKVVFISGISKIVTKTISLEYADKRESANSISLYNLKPLVRILNLVFENKEIALERVSKLLILSTEINSFTNLLKNTNLKDEQKSVDNLVIDVTDKVKDDECLMSNLRKMCDVTETNDKEMKFIRLDNTKNDINSILITIIKVATLIEYPHQLDFIQNLTIEFTKKQCDYDKFDECFETLRKAVEREDDKKQILYFNLTPGTGIAGSLMTLFSIDNDRYLYYYAQHSDGQKDGQRIRPVDKSVIPLENLLSQALENVTKNK